MNNIFFNTFEKHKKLALESLNDYNWEEKVDWSVFNTPEDTSRSFDQILETSENDRVEPENDKIKVPTIISVPTGEWWDMYNQLPEQIKKTAREKYNLFLNDPTNSILHFKPLKYTNTQENYWSVNINGNYRSVGIRTDIPDGFKMKWIFIGNHNQYDTLWKRLSRKPK